MLQILAKMFIHKSMTEWINTEEPKPSVNQSI